MPDDDSSEPSLFLARHEKAHREHLQHQHNKLHRRQTTEPTATASEPVVTEITATVSIVQQIDVDSNGNTLFILTIPADATDSASQAVLINSYAPTTTTPAQTPSSYAVSGASSTALNSPSQTISSPLVSQTSYSSQSAATALTSTPSISASFTSLTISSNSTTLVSSSSVSSHNFTNSSSLTTSRSSLTYLTSSSSSTSSDDSSVSSTSSSNSFTLTTTELQLIPTGSLLGGAGGTAVAPGTATLSTAASGDGTDSNPGSSVSTSAVVGGVVGSVAGVAVIALLLLFIVKWRKNRSGTLLSLGSGRDGADAATGGLPSQPPGGMVERRSFAYAVPAALTSLTGYKRSSKQTDRTASSTAGSERGFYRVSGRKLPSVVQTGGDGYGGGVLDNNTMSGSSFYRDSHGFYGGPGTPTFPPLEKHRESGQIGTPVLRPSPARTPVTEQGPFSAALPPVDPLPSQPDVLGRSHPSQDGSHTSRFTEEV